MCEIPANVILAEQFGGSDLYLLCLFCAGTVDAIEAIYINDVNTTDLTGITTVNYLGTATQTPDPTLVGIFLTFNVKSFFIYFIYIISLIVFLYVLHKNVKFAFGIDISLKNKLFNLSYLTGSKSSYINWSS
jgi:hypothetical protein